MLHNKTTIFWYLDQPTKLDSLDGEDWYANWLALWIFYVAPQETDWPIFQATDC